MLILLLGPCNTLLDIDGLEVPEIWVLMCNKASDHELSRKTCKRQSCDTAQYTSSWMSDVSWSIQ